ncbi:MAG TPA: hypothetical protein PLX64_15700, partial [Flavobacteriales bacterium]|nr:hypothetical protein [Flavobacteriales bacterium]
VGLRNDNSQKLFLRWLLVCLSILVYAAILKPSVEQTRANGYDPLERLTLQQHIVSAHKAFERHALLTP